MSKAFTKESDNADDDDDLQLPPIPGGGKNYITPKGYAALRSEWLELMDTERPKIVEAVFWAASNGDRSENGDYIYGRKRLREIDRRMSYLSRAMKQAKIVDPAKQEQRDSVRFGAIVEVADEANERRTLTLVGEDEADATAGRISWAAPIARALVGARVGDVRVVRLPAGEKSYEVIAIRYPD